MGWRLDLKKMMGHKSSFYELVAFYCVCFSMTSRRHEL